MDEILAFWFDAPAATRGNLWFGGDEETDAVIRERFGPDLDRAARGELDAWCRTPRGRLALIVLLDQFSRNVHRGTPKAFAQDALALRLCLEGLDAGVDRALRPVERAFFYMPMQHAEDRDAQRRSVQCFEELVLGAPAGERAALEGFLRYARGHRDVVERFGRFPHRNRILGRPSTPEELAFLKHGGD